MNNDNVNQQQMGDRYEQEFMSELNKSSMDTKNKNIKRRKKRKIMIVIFATITVLMVLLTVLCIIVFGNRYREEVMLEDDVSDEFFDAESSMVAILVAPSTAKITIDGQQYANGEFEWRQENMM